MSTTTQQADPYDSIQTLAEDNDLSEYEIRLLDVQDMDYQLLQRVASVLGVYENMDSKMELTQKVAEAGVFQRPIGWTDHELWWIRTGGESIPLTEALDIDL